ncbi:uncharacterized protein [Cicer arietinum]|uniref:uncharacterized protein n=1 Tax=Cicer arietinum TaxID=3827 RepID=UPI003CC643C9
MLIDLLPFLEKTFYLILGQERQLQPLVISNSVDEKSPFTMQVSHNFGGRGYSFSSNRGRGRGFGSGHGSKFCTHCQRTNHTIDTCFLNLTSNDESYFVANLEPHPYLSDIHNKFNQLLQMFQSNMSSFPQVDTPTTSTNFVVCSHPSINSIVNPKIGIINQRSCVKCPHQNGVVERKHQHILNVARSLSFQSNIPNSYACTTHNNRTKFDNRARKTVFLSYRDGTKGYLLYDVISHEFVVSRNVIFYETTFTFSNNVTNSNYENSPLVSVTDDVVVTLSDDHTDCNNSPIEAATSITQSSIPDTAAYTHIPQTPILELRHSTRLKNTPAYLEDYQCSVLPSQIPNNTFNVVYPISSTLSYANCALEYYIFCLNISSIKEPQTFNRASKYEFLNTAMKDELTTLVATNTWTIVDLRHGKRPIDCKLVYKVKHHVDESIDKYKARLVAKGYTQLEGVDYFNTFSLVAKLTTVRTILAKVALKNWYLE